MQAGQQRVLELLVIADAIGDGFQAGAVGDKLRRLHSNAGAAAAGARAVL